MLCRNLQLQDDNLPFSDEGIQHMNQNSIHCREDLHEAVLQARQHESDVDVKRRMANLLEKELELMEAKSYEQYLKVKSIEQHLREAHDDVEQAKALHLHVHEDVIRADNRIHNVNSLEDVMTESWVHSLEAARMAHQVEHDVEDFEVDTQFDELRAEVDYDHALSVYKEMRATEQAFKQSLDYMKE